MSSWSLRNILAISGTVLALAIAAPVEAAKFTITIDDAGTCNGTWQTTGSASSPTVTCVPGTPPPAGAPTCSITPSQIVSANTAVTLTLANCSPSSGLTYSWNQGSTSGPQVSTAATFTTSLLTTTTTYFATVTANGTSTVYQTTVTVNAVSPPPGSAASCANYSTAYFGDLLFDGLRYSTSGVSGNTVLYAKFVVPNPLPANWVGKTTSIAMFSFGSGDHWRKAYLSKTPCDFTPTGAAFSQGISNSLYVTYGAVGFYSVTLMPGEVWYLNVKNENYSGGSSCGSGVACDFALRAYAPN